MPKYAILSDIHSNLEALEVVLEQCRAAAVDAYVSLGDIVGYNANPAECLHLVRDLNWSARVRGNHDDYTANGNTEMSGFNPNAKAAINWTRAQLSDPERAWIGKTPFRASIPGAGITLVHATLDSPENWGYVFDAHHAADNFSYQLTPLCFCGHSHVPVAFYKKPITARNERNIEQINDWVSNPTDPQADEEFDTPDKLTVEYKGGHKYLFNIGSIGQPRNGDPRASFVIVDTDAHTVTRYRVPYDVATAQQKILDAGLPERLARRLALGN